MDEFESLLEKERISVERYIRFRLNDPTEADDILQDVCLTAFRKFSGLRNQESFKAWLIAIARNKVNDYFRKEAACYEIPLERLTEDKLKFYPLQAFSYDSLVPSILFHNTETAFRLNGSIHPEQSTMNAFQIIENFFVKSSQFFV